MKNFIKKHKTILVALLIILAYTVHAHYVVAENTKLKEPSEIERVATELKTLRDTWYSKESKINELRTEALKVEQEKLNLEPFIREKQSELDKLTGKK